MKIAFAFATAFALASAWDAEYTKETMPQEGSQLHALFEEWMAAFDRQYENEAEKTTRFLTWVDNLESIAAHNSRQDNYRMRMNQFGDMTKSQFRRYVHGEDGACFKRNHDDFIINSFGQDREHIIQKLINGVSEKVTDKITEIREKANPTSVDWTLKGVVTPIKDQGQCGSCWSFSATGAMECNYAIKTGELNSLSEQQLVDCAGILYGSFGCNGGQMTGAMKYAAKNGGLCLESDYPYTAKDGTCKATTCGTFYDANLGVEAVTPKSSQEMEDAVVKGCVSIGIEADQTAFQFYSSGVLTGNCGTSIDHGVLIVGYGEKDGNKYWKVKNSWGTSWGEDGYVLICRDCGKNGSDGECGILTEPNVPEY